MDKRERIYFDRFYRKAEQIKDSPGRIEVLLHKVKTRISHNKRHLQRASEQVQTMFRLVRSYATGQYRDIPATRVVMIIAAFIYLVSPIDAVFDFMPGGFIDDATILLWLYDQLRGEMEAFLAWEESRDAGMEGVRKGN